MHETISTAIAPLIGLSCWGVERVHGSILSFEFGPPQLYIREPIVSASSSVKVRARLAQRRVKPVGDWNLFVSCCHWRLEAADDFLAEDADSHKRIEAAARILDGQKLAGFLLDARSRTTTFSFDLGATLTAWPYDDDDDEQWSLHRRDGLVLGYKADGQCSFSSASDKPGQEASYPVVQGVCVP